MYINHKHCFIFIVFFVNCIMYEHYELVCCSSTFEQPSMEEGVDEIVHINFVPHFKDPKQEKLYKMYLL